MSELRRMARQVIAAFSEKRVYAGKLIMMFEINWSYIARRHCSRRCSWSECIVAAIEPLKMNAILSLVILSVILIVVKGQGCGWGAPYGGCKSKVGTKIHFHLISDWWFHLLSHVVSLRVKYILLMWVQNGILRWHMHMSIRDGNEFNDTYKGQYKNTKKKN